MPLRRLVALLCLLLTAHLTVAGSLGACTMRWTTSGSSTAAAPEHGTHDEARSSGSHSAHDAHVPGPAHAHGPADDESPTPHGSSAACLSAAGCVVAATIPAASELPTAPVVRARVAPRAERVPPSALAAPELPPPRG